MEVVYGGAREGAFLCNHPLVRSIHLTGSAATFDAVVWGKAKKVPLPRFRRTCHAPPPAYQPQPVMPVLESCILEPPAVQLLSSSIS